MDEQNEINENLYDLVLLNFWEIKKIEFQWNPASANSLYIEKQLK